jgi:hypothetical protein
MCCSNMGLKRGDLNREEDGENEGAFEQAQRLMISD